MNKQGQRGQEQRVARESDDIFIHTQEGNHGLC